MALRSMLPELRPTRRGWTVAAVAVVAFALGATAGARSLNAVVVPALVALLAGALQLARADPPTLERERPDPGFAGDRRRVTVAVESAVPCTVMETVDGGLDVVDGGDPDGSPSKAVGHGGSLAYEIELRRRGEHCLGPARCRQTDSLGLFERTIETDAETAALVYPDVFALEGAALAGLLDRALGDDRSSFDRLREFAPGDSMRDIHWRASAKRSADEFVVAEYRSRSEATHVDVVGESALGSADAMAEAVASLAVRLLEAGVTVTVTVPAGRCVARPGDSRELLGLLARTGDGWVDDDARAAADVLVSGEGGRANVTVADRTLGEDRLLGGRREVLP